MDTERQSGVQSLDRAFELIEQLAGSPGGLQLSELTQRTGLHKSTVHRLLSALIARGYVAQEEQSKRYRLTLRLFELSGRVVDGIDVLDASRGVLEQLRDRVKEAVHLVVQEGADIVYVFKAESRHGAIRMFSRIGMRRPMYCTAVGKSILAAMEDAQVEKIWNASVIREYTPHTIVSLPALMEELAVVREKGYALDNEENELGVRCIAAAIPDYRGRSRAAFSISSPASRMTDQHIAELTPEILDARRRIAESVGYSGKTEDI